MLLSRIFYTVVALLLFVFQDSVDCTDVASNSSIETYMDEGDKVLKSRFCSEKTYTYSMSVIIHNEASYLDEWISYHWAIGIGHFYVYDHGSTDNPLAVLEKYIVEGIVSLHNWTAHVTYNPGPQGKKRPPGSQPRTSAQNQAYAHSLTRYGSRSKFLLFLDVDEFLVPGEGMTSKTWKDLDVLGSENSKSPSGPSVCLNWLTMSNLEHRFTSVDIRLKWFFVSSKYRFRPDGLVLSAYTDICESPHQRLAKHMVRTTGRRAASLLACANPHTCGGKLAKSDAPAKQLYVLHFATKSFAEFSKKPAAKAGGGNPRNHSFEFFAKNSCRWSMGKERRQQLIRSGSLGYKQCKRSEDTIQCLERDLDRNKPLISMPQTVDLFGKLIASCLITNEYPLGDEARRRCPSFNFMCSRGEQSSCDRSTSNSKSKGFSRGT